MGFAKDGRILALDVGDRRIGLAISDPLWMTAQPLESLHVSSPQAAMSALQTLVEEKEISLLVAGLPVHRDGSESKQSLKIRRFAESAALATARPLLFFDERGTTREAERVLLAANVRRSKRKKSRDKLAAVLILTHFLSAI